MIYYLFLVFLQTLLRIYNFQRHLFFLPGMNAAFVCQSLVEVREFHLFK